MRAGFDATNFVINTCSLVSFEPAIDENIRTGFKTLEVDGGSD